MGGRHVVYYSGVPNCNLLRPTKKCIKIYCSKIKLYEFCFFRLYKVCSCCGCEFDDYFFHGVCPYCDEKLNIDDPPQAGFVFFPELLLPTAELALFPELAFYP